MRDAGYIFVFVLLNTLGVVGQTTPNLLLPKDIDGEITLDISDIAKHHHIDLSYDHLSIYVANDHNTYPPNGSVQGKFTVIQNKLIFKPYFPFERGLSYVVKLNSGIKKNPTYIPFQIGDRLEVDQAKVLSIYPKSDLLPENVLRFYIYFKTPMIQEVALQHIKLINEDGKVDDYAFMKFKEELWSGDGKRLTILFDPGRIKRGVSDNMKLGPALERRHKYQLHISKEWQDIYGNQLGKDIVKNLVIEEAYREMLEVVNWKLEKPKYNTVDSLVIEFDRILDHTLIQSMIQISDVELNLIDGYWLILEREKGVKFFPTNKWSSGKYIIRFDTRLEDAAGNNLQNLLDHNKSDRNLDEIYQYIKFKI